MTNASNAGIYPRYCFHLSPTANVWCLMRNSQLHALDTHDEFIGEGFFFYKKLPVKWVRTVGVIVAVDEFSNKRSYTIDDSSGACIEALIDLQSTVNRPPDGRTHEPASHNTLPATQYDHLDIGNVIDVKGQLTLFRNEKQIRVESMVVIPSTSQELALWKKRAAFCRNVLDRPWNLRDKQLRQCRREAERSDTEAELKKQRIREIASRKAGKSAAKRQAAVDAQDQSSRGNQKTPHYGMEEIIRAASLGDGEYSALGL